MNRRAIGVYREPQFSPGKVEADAGIMDAVLSELSSYGVTTSAVDADGFATGAVVEAELILAMCQSEAALKRLAEVEANGAIALNPALAIRNCYRDLLGVGLVRAGVPTPPGVLLSTGMPLDTRALAALDIDAGVYIKRGDMHALGPDDVRPANGRSELVTELEAFARRGIRSVFVQQAAEGSTLKFYGVSGGEYFSVIAGEGEVSEAVSRALAEAATAAASMLGLHAWGGDAILNEDGFQIIDFNDWPSYSRVRSHAARAIARRAMKMLARAR